MKKERYENCFACGKDNPIGLKLQFTYADEKACAVFDLTKLYEGYPQIIHGGIVSTILDESMAKIILHKGITAVTGELNVKFKKSLFPDVQYQVIAGIELQKKRYIKVTAQIFDTDMHEYARANAVFLPVKS